MNRQQEKLQERFQEESQSEILGERSEYSPREFLDKRIEAIFFGTVVDQPVQKVTVPQK